MPSICSGLSWRIALAGVPMIKEPSGNSLPSVTSEPAPTRQFLPIFAPLRITDWMPLMSLRERAVQILCITEPALKAAQTRELFEQIDAVAIDSVTVLQEPDGLPGRPDRPRLVPPKDVPTRSPFTLEGRAALLHAIAHIEFNAINLALDAV